MSLQPASPYVRRGINTQGSAIVGVTKSVNDLFFQIEKKMNQAVIDNQAEILARVKTIMYAAVPVRSGKLLDTMLNNLTIIVRNGVIHVSTITPEGYPVRIINPRHRGEIGYSYGKYTPKHKIPNVHKIRDTKKGAYYLLNDPSAIEDYMSVMGRYLYPFFESVLKHIIPEFKIRARCVENATGRLFLYDEADIKAGWDDFETLSQEEIDLLPFENERTDDLLFEISVKDASTLTEKWAIIDAEMAQRKAIFEVNKKNGNL